MSFWRMSSRRSRSFIRRGPARDGDEAGVRPRGRRLWNVAGESLRAQPRRTVHAIPALTPVAVRLSFADSVQSAFPMPLPQSQRKHSKFVQSINADTNSSEDWQVPLEKQSGGEGEILKC